MSSSVLAWELQRGKETVVFFREISPSHRRGKVKNNYRAVLEVLK